MCITSLGSVYDHLTCTRTCAPCLAASDNASSDDDMQSVDEHSSSSKKAAAAPTLSQKREHKLMLRRDHWSAQFATPEWMLEVPCDLNGRGRETGEGAAAT